MPRNVVILTSGLTGSSVLTGLIARAGHWTGPTFKKTTYDTFENKELIALNLKLFETAKFEGNYLMEFRPEAIERISALYGTIDDTVYREFVSRCEEHAPWIWKDPRLWMTIGFWNKIAPLKDCAFVLLTRGLMQSWVSSMLRGQVTTYRYSKHYELSIQQTAQSFLDSNGLSYIRVSYEGLIQHPAETIEQLNRHIGTQLTVEDLRQVYTKPLYKNPRSSASNYARALAIYLKNYSRRLDLAEAKR